MSSMGQKRKRELPARTQSINVVAKPSVGARTFTSGKSARDGLATGSRESFVAFQQQIFTPHSALPLSITHSTVLILQHYLDVSPTCDEIFNAWRHAALSRDDRVAEAAVSLLAQIIQILTPLPFFRTSLIGLVKKLISSSEPYHDFLNRFITSGNRQQILFGLQLASAAVHVDPPDPSSTSSGRLSLALWAVLVEGGSVRALPKVLGMRRRNREGLADYGNTDPLDRPDIRHLCLHFILPLLSTTAFQAHAKPILPHIYSDLQTDPPTTIFRVLNAMWSAITAPTSGVGRRIALTLLDEKAVEHFLGLLNRDEFEPTSERTVSEMVMAFLEGVTTVPGQGICFPDEGWYPRQNRDEFGGLNEVADEEDRRGVGDGQDDRFKKGLHNRILSNVIRRVGTKAVDDRGKVGEAVIKVLRACPEIVAGYWPHSSLALDPRLSAKWMASMAYVGRIISLPPPPISSFRQPTPRGSDLETMPFGPHPPSVATIIESILPSPLTKQHLSKGLQHPDGLVQHMTALTLARALQKLDAVQKVFLAIEAELGAEPSTSAENPWARRRRELEMECRKRVPEVLVVIAFAQKSATLARVNPESGDEPDPALVAKSSMLTESSLRLLGLYHHSLPSIAQEAKFDVGKLLVSSSSAKAERREKREGRAGSVISDSGSVGSVGTVGTAGMMGGFGHARGDVEGFEALSQVHVLSLLGEVKDWNWANKAAGSQYTYLYHVLLLHLSTPHPITQAMTTSLLNRLLLPTILFEHDPGELEIWLSALPRLPPTSDLSSRATLLVQHIHLLSFLDDCMRRAMKTPYRYIEDGMALVPEYFSPAKPYEMISPILMTVLEQLNAKIVGELMSTEAAGVVMCWLRRVLLGLAGKMRDEEFVKAVITRLETTLKSARDKGQARTGLGAVLAGMKADMRGIFGREVVAINGEAEEAGPILVDDKDWTRSSLESIILDFNILPEDLNGEIDALLERASIAASARICTFCTHLLSTRPSTTRSRRLLWLVEQSLRNNEDRVLLSRAKEFVFDAAVIRKLMTATDRNEYRNELGGIVATLSNEDLGDRAIAEGFVRDIVQDESVGKLKKGVKLEQFLAVLRPWTRFLEPRQAASSLQGISSAAHRLVTPVSEEVKDTISAVILVADDPQGVLEYLPRLLPLGIVRPFTTLVRKANQQSGVGNINRRFGEYPVTSDTLRNLVTNSDDEAFSLIEALVSVAPGMARSCGGILQGETALINEHRLLPVFAMLLDLNAGLSIDRMDTIASTALSALQDGSLNVRLYSAAQHVLCQVAIEQPAALIEAVEGLFEPSSGYSLALAQATEKLANMRLPVAMRAVHRLTMFGLQWAVHTLSSDGHLSAGDLDTMGHIGEVIDLSPDIAMDDEVASDFMQLADEVISRICRAQFENTELTDLASTLCLRVTIKASDVRKYLQQVFSKPIPNADPARSSVINLIHTLFRASTYASCQPAFLSSLLPLYRGTLSTPDQQILSLFQLFEAHRKLSTASLFTSWSASGAVGSQKPLDVLLSLDAGKVFATCVAFPLTRMARPHEEEKPVVNDGIYDPAFVLPLFCMVLDDHLTGLDWVEVLRSNMLGLAICSLSSRNAAMRALGRKVLAKTLQKITITPFQERPQLLYILQLLRHAIPSPPTRLPTLTTLFLAHTLRSLATPSHYLFPLVSRFLLQRPTLDLYDVPMLYSMLYARGEGFRRERGWIIRLLRDGVRSAADWRILRRRHTFDLLATLYQSAVDISFRRQILQALESMTRVPSAALSLTYRNNFIGWLDQQWIMNVGSPNRAAEEEKAAYVRLVENVIISLVAAEMKESEQGRELSWASAAERFMVRASVNSDAERLEHLGRITARLSEIPNSVTSANILPALIARVVELDPDGTGKVSTRTIEYLFQASLSLRLVGMKKDVREAVEQIGWRVRRLESDVGDWVRRETRRAEWEAMRSA